MTATVAAPHADARPAPMLRGYRFELVKLLAQWRIRLLLLACGLDGWNLWEREADQRVRSRRRDGLRRRVRRRSGLGQTHLGRRRLLAARTGGAGSLGSVDVRWVFLG